MKPQLLESNVKIYDLFNLRNRLNELVEKFRMPDEVISKRDTNIFREGNYTCLKTIIYNPINPELSDFVYIIYDSEENKIYGKRERTKAELKFIYRNLKEFDKYEPYGENLEKVFAIISNRSLAFNFYYLRTSAKIKDKSFLRNMKRSSRTSRNIIDKIKSQDAAKGRNDSLKLIQARERSRRISVLMNSKRELVPEIIYIVHNFRNVFTDHDIYAVFEYLEYNERRIFCTFYLSNYPVPQRFGINYKYKLLNLDKLFYKIVEIENQNNLESFIKRKRKMPNWAFQSKIMSMFIYQARLQYEYYKENPKQIIDNIESHFLFLNLPHAEKISRNGDFMYSHSDSPPEKIEDQLLETLSKITGEMNGTDDE